MKIHVIDTDILELDDTLLYVPNWLILEYD